MNLANKPQLLLERTDDGPATTTDFANSILSCSILLLALVDLVWDRYRLEAGIFVLEDFAAEPAKTCGFPRAEKYAESLSMVAEPASKVETGCWRAPACGRQIEKVDLRWLEVVGGTVERAYSHYLEASWSTVEREAPNRNACFQMQHRLVSLAGLKFGWTPAGEPLAVTGGALQHVLTVASQV